MPSRVFPGRYRPTFVFIVMTVAAAEAAVGLGIIITISVIVSRSMWMRRHLKL